MCYSRDWQREAKAREAHGRRAKVIDGLRADAEKRAEIVERPEAVRKDRPEPAPAR